MSTREHRFDVSGTPRIEVRMPVGDVRVVEGESGKVVVQLDGKDSTLDRFIVEQRGGVVVIEPERSSMGWRSSVTLTLRVGEPPAIHARLTAADLHTSVALHRLTVDTASGDVSLADVDDDLEVRSASGDLRAGSVGGRLDVSSASGEVRVGRISGSVGVRTASGDVRLEAAADDVAVKSASGDVAVGEFTGSWLDVKTMSGDTSIGVPSGRRFDVSFSTLSGDVRTDFPVSEGASSGATARLAVKSVSGDVLVHAAEAGRPR